MLTAGTVLQGRYSIIRTLGVGGMGAVYLAADSRLGNTPVAVKELVSDPNASPAEQAQAQQQFQTEASMLAALNHPNLPRVSDFFSEAGRHYLVMDYIDGETLQDLLNRTQGFLSEQQVLSWATQLCDVLTYLHGRQPPVIFRDLKPANIMLDRHGTLKLIDFGIARLFKPGKTTDTLRMGTTGYAPPEQYAGQGQTDVRSDIYSLGATLHHLLTKRDPTQHPPFSFDMALPRSINPSVSAQAEGVILQAVAYDRTSRFGSAAEMKQALLGRPPPPPPPPPQQKSLQGLRPFLLFAATILVLAAVLAAMGGLAGLFRPKATPMPTAAVAPVRTPAVVVPTTPVRATDTRVPATPMPASVSTPTPRSTATAVPTEQILFVSDRDGNWEIYAMSPDGQNQRRLTRDEAKDYGPALAPDGVRLAFVSERDGQPDIYVLNLRDNGLTRLTDDPSSDVDPQWSPDGTEIAFLSNRGVHAELYMMNSDGSDQVALTSFGPGDKWFNWTTDGTRLLVEWRAYSGARDIYVMNADGSDQARITDGTSVCWNASWSPDGRRVLFVQQVGADAELFTVDAQGRDRIQVTDNDTWDQAPTWSPDGSRIAFVSQLGDWRLMVTDSRRQERQVATKVQPDYVGVWSPDGERIALVSDQDGDRDIYVVKSDGSDLRQLTRNTADDFWPVWTRP